MSNLDPGPLARYNSLQDKHLAGYFSNTKMKKHLIKAGLVKKDGEIVDDNTYRLKMAKKEHQKHVKDLLATAIVHKALDVERMRQYEFRKKLDELYKIELVQRVKGEKKRKGDEEIVPLLLPKGGRRSKSHPGDSFRGSSESSSTGGEGDSPLNDSLPEILYDQHKRRLFTKRAASQDRAERMAEEDRVPYYRSHTQPHPPQKRKQTKRKTPRGLILARTDTTVAHRIQLQSLAEVMLKFTGPNLHLTNDMFLSHKLHEVMVLQQHCGGSTLCVFREQLPANTTFSFISRRHRGAPFGLTLYIDGVQDIRVSSCCEYKHRPGSMLGGKNAKFLFLGVNGAAPCYKCQAAFSVAEETRSTKRKSNRSSSKKKEEQLSADADNEKAEDVSLAVKINIHNREEDDVYEEGNEESAKCPVLEKETSEANAEDKEPLASSADLPTKTDKLTQTGEDLSANSNNEKKENETEEKDMNSNDYDDEDFENDDVDEQDKKQEDIEQVERNYESDFGSSPSSSSEDEEDKEGKNKRKRRRTKKERDNQEGERGVESVDDKSDSESDNNDDSSREKEDMKVEDQEKEDIRDGDREEEDSEVIDKEEGNNEEEAVKERTVEGRDKEEEDKEEEDKEEEDKEKEDKEKEDKEKEDKEKEDKEEEDNDGERKEKGILLQSGAAEDSASQASEYEGETKEDKDDINEDGNEVDNSAGDAADVEKVEVVGTDNDENAGEDRTSDSVHDPDGTEKDENISNTEQLKDTDNEDKNQDVGTRETIDDQSAEETEAAENVAGEAEKASGNQEEEDVAVVSEDKEEEKVEEPNSSEEQYGAEDADESKVGDEKREDEVGNGKADVNNEVEVNGKEQNDVVDHGGDAEETGKSEVVSEYDSAKEDPEKNIIDGREAQESDSEKKTEVDIETEDHALEATKEEGDHPEEESAKEENDSSDNTNKEEQVVSDADPNVVNDEDSLGNKGEAEVEEKEQEEENGHEPKSDVENAEGENPVEEGNDSSVVENSEENKEESANTQVVNNENLDENTDANVAGTEGEQGDAESSADKTNDQENDQEAQDGNEEDVGGEDTVLNSEVAKDDDSEISKDDAEQTPVVFDPNEELSNIENEKDPEAALFDSGRDPDGVADEYKERNDTPLEPQPIVKHEGSIALLIDSTSDVELSSVALSPNQVEEISEVVSKNPVDSFSLRNAEMDDENVAKVKEALANSGNLKMLNLNLNKIGPSGAGHLADVVKNNSNLKMLMLHGNEIGDEGIGYLVDALLENTNVSTLDVGDCSIGDQGAFRIAELLENNNSITELNISGNQISAKGWSAISDGIKKNSTIMTLSLDFSDLRDEGTEIVCEGIRDNSSLKSIDFEGNRIGDIGGRRILAAVKNNRQIIDVTLMPENDISPELQEEIKSILLARAG